MKLLKPLGAVLLILLVVGLGVKFSDGLDGLEDKALPSFFLVVMLFVLLLGIRRILRS